MAIPTIFTEALNGLSIGGTDLLRVGPLLLIVLSAVAVTRNIGKLKVIILPMLLLWKAVGVDAGYLAMALATISAISSMFTLSQLGDILTGTWERVKTTRATGGFAVTKGQQERWQAREQQRQARAVEQEAQKEYDKAFARKAIDEKLQALRTSTRMAADAQADNALRMLREQQARLNERARAERERYKKWMQQQASGGLPGIVPGQELIEKYTKKGEKR